MANESDSRMEWLTDAPLTALAADGLDRRQFVFRARELLDEVASTAESTVIGVVGPWGSGKSSSLNMIVEGLDNKRWRVQHLSPWAVTGADAIISELLAAISAGIPKKQGKAAKAQEALTQYGSVVTPALLAIPFAGAAAKGVSDALIQRVTAIGTVHERSLVVAKALQDLAQPMLLIVDDVDRLQPDELLALFKAVRVLGRLPFVHYLLAYDQQTVLDVLVDTPLASRDESRALAFLEKIVNLPLVQPPTRPEQAQSLFEKGLGSVLEDTGHAALTEDQQARLSEEREALLNAALSEPRVIRRFLSQLRIYLPLIGPSEIDVVDFLVLTLLRTSYPTLYREVATQHTHYVSSSAEGPYQVRGDYVNDANLARLRVPEQERERIRNALVRLFPLLSDEDGVRHAWDQNRRRRDRRASDPDIAARYFALGPISGELPDGVLVAALQAWTSEREAEGDEALRVREVLTPDLNAQSECDVAAAVIRRAAARTDELSPSQAANLLTVVVELLPSSSRTGGGAGLGNAFVGWLARLLELADGPSPSELLALMDRPDSSESPLPHLVRAMRQARPTGPGNPWTTAAGSSPWFTSVIDVATSHVWDRLVGNVRRGDDAPDEPAGLYHSWLDETLGPRDVDRRLRAAVDGGLPIPDLAARFVETRTHLSGTHESLTGFDAPTFIRRLGEERVSQDAALKKLVSQSATDAVRDEEDISWRSRRSIATNSLVVALRQKGSGQLRLPKLTPVDAATWQDDHKPDLLGRGGASPDLFFQIAVKTLLSRAPTADTPAPATNQATWPDFEDGVLAILSSGPALRWVREVATSWHVEEGSWAISGSQPPRRLDARLEARSLLGEAATPQQQAPVTMGAQVLTGPADGSKSSAGPPGFTLCIGLSMEEIGADRRPSTVRHNQAPLPAALTLGETARVLEALLGSCSDALRVGRLIRPEAPTPALVAEIIMEAPGGMGRVVDLAGVRRVDDSVMSRMRALVPVQVRGAGPDAYMFAEAEDELSVAILNEWLLQQGYRGYESSLADLLSSRH